jgi:hypothetical protein
MPMEGILLLCRKSFNAGWEIKYLHACLCVHKLGMGFSLLCVCKVCPPVSLDGHLGGRCWPAQLWWTEPLCSYETHLELILLFIEQLAPALSKQACSVEGKESTERVVSKVLPQHLVTYVDHLLFNHSDVFNSCLYLAGDKITFLFFF